MEIVMIEINNLMKIYGTTPALEGISFKVEKGEIMGFLGPNGAGKSTTLNILTGYLSSTSGSASVGGIDIYEYPDEAKKLIEVTRESFYRGIANAVPGKRIGDIGFGIEQHVTENGFSVVRSYVGHGVGHELHEDPEVPNYGNPGRGVRLCAGMTIAVEPMVNVGTHRVRVLDDKWTVVTEDGKLSAHYEHTVAITDDGPLLLTKVC